MGGKPFPDGWEPDDDRGGADEDFASVVFDEDFIRAAPVHEPTAVERLLAAAQARADAEAARARSYGGPSDGEGYGEGYGPAGEYGDRRTYGVAYDPDNPHYDPNDPNGEFGPYGRHGGALRPYRGTARWHRPVAWILAVVMGIGMVALAFTAVYRGASGNRQDRVPPPATTGVDTSRGGGGGPAASTEYSVPKVSAVPRSTP